VASQLLPFALFEEAVVEVAMHVLVFGKREGGSEGDVYYLEVLNCHFKKIYHHSVQKYGP
jgi:hypothetical protein